MRHVDPFAISILSNYNLDSGIRGICTLLQYLFCQITTWTVACEAFVPFCNIYFVKLQLGQWHPRHVDPFAVFILSNYNLDSGIRGMWTLLQYLFCQITTWTVACEAFVPFCNIYFVKLQLGQWHLRHVDPFAVFILSNYNLDSGNEACGPFCSIYFVKLQLGQWHVRHVHPLQYLFCQIITLTVSSGAFLSFPSSIVGKK